MVTKGHQLKITSRMRFVSTQKQSKMFTSILLAETEVLKCMSANGLPIFRETREPNFNYLKL